VTADVRRGRPENWLSAVTALILRIALAVAVGYVLYRLGFVIVVVLMSVMLALTLRPLVDRVQRWRLFRRCSVPVRRSIATTLVFVLLAAALVSLGVLVVRPLTQEIAALSANWPTLQRQLFEKVEWARERYDALPPDIRTWIEAQDFGSVGGQAAEQIQHFVQRTVHSGMLLIELILIPVLAFSFLTEGRPLKREFAAIIPMPRLRDALYVLRQTASILESYAVGQLILALIAGVVVWMLMMALGIRYALAMAVIAAVTRVIPVVGPIVGAIPLTVVAGLSSLEHGITVLIAFCLMHLVESKVIMPRLIGYRIKLHPAVVIIVLLIGAEFFGVWGMFLAAPVAAVVKSLIYYFYVRPGKRKRDKRSGVPPQAPVVVREPELERPAVAGIRSHSGAH
jgi:predicted PurR-regulated permease PerM